MIDYWIYSSNQIKEVFYEYLMANLYLQILVLNNHRTRVSTSSIYCYLCACKISVVDTPHTYMYFCFSIRTLQHQNLMRNLSHKYYVILRNTVRGCVCRPATSRKLDHKLPMNIKLFIQSFFGWEMLAGEIKRWMKQFTKYCYWHIGVTWWVHTDANLDMCAHIKMWAN